MQLLNDVKQKMFCRSVTFGVKSVEKLPQTENFFELTIPNLEAPVFESSIERGR